MAQGDEVLLKPRRARTLKPPPQPSTPDPIEIAMAAAASGKPLPEVARRVLEEQARLLSAQCGELRLRRIGEGVRAALWAILALAALVVVGLVVAVVVRASRTDALIVQSFRVPPALNGQGLTGEVVATQVLDRLADMQGGTESVRAASTYANNWEDDLKIDIPNTGATTSEVWKLLRGWLGKETRISGEVIELDGKLALTARVGSSPGQRFVSPAGNLDELITQAAELIYRQTQPYRYAVFVARTPGREGERFSILKPLTTDESPIERKWAFSGLSYDRNNFGDFRAGVAMGMRALAIDPQMVPALANTARAHKGMGHDQAAFDLNSYKMTLPKSSEYDPVIEAANACGNGIDIGQITRDAELIDRSAACLESAPSSYAESIPAARLAAAVIRNDPEPVLRFRQPPSPSVPAQIVARTNALAQLTGEMLRGPTPRLAEALDEFTKVAEVPATAGPSALYIRGLAPVEDWPLQARALIMLGRNAEAASLIARTPRDCYECVRVRGLVAQASGDPQGAHRWFAEAVRQGPRLPPAYVDWARLLAKHRRIANAEALFARAARLAPHWAEPLKYWGDALAAQGKRGEALEKYAAALKHAPKWMELRQARQRASDH